jgi:hypothetical protein
LIHLLVSETVPENCGKKILKNLETGRNLHYSFQLFNHHYNQPFVITSNDRNFHPTTNDTAAITSLAAIIDYLQ